MDHDETWHGGRPRHQPHCVGWGHSFPHPKVTAPNFWPMSVVAKELDGSRCHLIGRYRPRPRPHCVGWGPSSQLTPAHKKGGTSRPHFSAHVLWPNGWMDQDATWYGGRPRPWPHCVKWGPSPPPKGHSPLFSAHACCGRTAGWIKMTLGIYGCRCR